jgi:Schlafen, AlbA_2
MHLLGKSFDKIDSDDIERLIANEVQETKSLDYKRDFNLKEDKREFLFDITSFYNTDGGFIIYGISERKDDSQQNTGIPDEIIGIDIENEDKLFQQIEDIIKTNTEPNITSIRLKTINVNGKNILVIYISKGLGLPSMVTWKSTNKFYRRRNTGKYLVDIYELNQMFMQNQLLKESIDTFRKERIIKVRNNKVFPTLDIKSSLMIHLIPFSFLKDDLIDISNFTSNSELKIKLKPILTRGGWDTMYNIDGFATFTGYIKSNIEAYTQFFRNGIIELYSSNLTEKIESNVAPSQVHEIQLNEIFESVKNALLIQENLEIESPIYICISLHGIKDSQLILNNGRVSRPFLEDELILPPVLLHSFESDIKNTLNPIFDMIWQSAGWNKFINT